MSKPTPLSSTSKRTRRPSAAARTWTSGVADFELYFTALLIRLVQTWRNRAGSPGTAGSSAMLTAGFGFGWPLYVLRKNEEIPRGARRGQTGVVRHEIAKPPKCGVGVPQARVGPPRGGARRGRGVNFSAPPHAQPGQNRRNGQQQHDERGY